MATQAYEDGRLEEIWIDGEKVWDREDELKDVAAAAARAAIENASGVSGDAHAAEDAARKAVEEAI